MPPKPKYYAKKVSKPSSISRPTSTMSTEVTSASYLVIVESPSKCAKIESYLGSDYRCIASKGHIRELLGLKSIDTKNNYQPTFTIIPEKADHVNKMREIISYFPKQNIILATDDDREGEGIAWHICEVFKLSVATTRRIVFHEITQSAIHSAIQEPKTIDVNLVHAQHARHLGRIQNFATFVETCAKWKNECVICREVSNACPPFSIRQYEGTRGIWYGNAV